MSAIQYRREMIGSLLLLLLAGCTQSEEEQARERAAEFWNSNSDDFFDAQDKHDEAMTAYQRGLYPEVDSPGLEARDGYRTLALHASNRSETAESRYEAQLIDMVEEIATHGMDAANYIVEAAKLRQQDNPPLDEIENNEYQHDHHFDQQGEAISSLRSELER